MFFYTHTLSNGIRLIHHPIDSPVGYCSLLINAGSRDESEDEHGLAHFIEHVIFKGTQKRKAYHILSRIDDVGGELNAYTTKEETCVYASFLKEDFRRAIELLYDIVFNSTFPIKELQKEKEVILDEINSYKDSPSDLILDDFEELIFQNDPIGRNILGRPETISKFTRSNIHNFINNNYHTDQMVLCTVGKIKHEKLYKIIGEYFNRVPSNIRNNNRVPILPYHPQTLNKKMDTFQSHIVIGNRAYDFNHSSRLGLLLLTNLLGGPGLNSRLNMSLREKNGIAYNIESIYTPYFGTGAFSIYFGSDHNNLEKSIKIVLKELKKLREKKLGKIQIHNARRQLKGQITIAGENKENLMLSIGRSFLLYNKVDTLEEIYSKIDNLSPEGLISIANEIFDPSLLSYLIYNQG